MKFSLVLGLAASLLLAACSAAPSTSTDGGTTAANDMPIGTELTGVTLSGSLAGKKMYLLPAIMNPSGCWMDSQYWTGSELFFGISSLDWTALNNGSLSYNSSCSPSAAFAAQTGSGVTGNFNIYRAKVVDSAWVLTNLSVNTSQTVSLSAAKLSGTLMAFVKYEKSSANGNIYLTSRLGDNSFSAPTAFAQNSSACNDDNPVLVNSGTRIIFTSSRAVADGSSCGANSVKKLWSSTYSGGAWQTPVAFSAPVPSGSGVVDQAWLDSVGTHLYWTGSGTTDCTGTVTTCIKTATGSGTSFPNFVTQIVTPISVLSWPTTAGDFVSHVGQFTQSSGISFLVCGISTYVGSSSTAGLTTLSGQTVYAGAASPSPPYYYYHTDFRTCLIQ